MILSSTSLRAPRTVALRHRRIGVLMGDVGGSQAASRASVTTGDAVLAALLDRGYDAKAVFLDRDIDLALRQANIEVAYLALGGRLGANGSIQGLLQMLGIPHTGSGVLASSLAMHKVKAKEIFRLHNLPTAPYYVLHRQRLAKASDPEQALRTHHGDFGFPVVVKPVRSAAALGVAVADRPEKLVQACEQAFAVDDEVMIERFVRGVEVSVAVIGDRALGAVEIEAGDDTPLGQVRRGHANFHIPPRLAYQRYRGIVTQAVRAHQALGCRGATCVDFIVSERGNEYLLEVNTLPSLSPYGLLPKIANASGMEFEDLVESVLHGSLLPRHGRGADLGIAQSLLPMGARLASSGSSGAGRSQEVRDVHSADLGWTAKPH